MAEDFAVRLSQQDTDHLLAAVEVALNADPEPDFGPGMRRWAIEQAARKLEAVADLQRQGIVTGEQPPEQVDELVRAALELIDLKDGPRDQLYREAKEPAWASLRAALAPFPDPEPEGGQ